MDWIPEKEATKIVGRSADRLRRLVKSGKWPIDYTAPNGRGYMYSLKGIHKMLDSYSSKTKNS